MRKRIKLQEDLNQAIKNNFLDKKQAEAYLNIEAQKTVLGLQSRIPQALQVNAGASALGGVAGSGSGQVIEIQRQILDGIRQLVQITRMDVSGLN